MATQNQDQKFFEVIKPHSNYEFIGRTKYWVGLSILLTAVTIAMVFLNAYVIKSRGHFLNWGVDFRGGTELLIDFNRPVDPGELRKTLAEIGHDNADVVRYDDPSDKAKVKFLVRIGAVSVLSKEQAQQAQQALAKQGDSSLHKFEWSEGGDKVYLRYDKAVPVETLSSALKAVGIAAAQVQQFGRPEDNTYEVTLVSLDSEMRRALDASNGVRAFSDAARVWGLGYEVTTELDMVLPAYDGSTTLDHAEVDG